MTGLLEQPEQPIQPGQQTPQGQGSDDGQYDDFMANAFNMIYEPKIADSIVNRLAKNPDPVDALANITLNIVERLESSATAKGIKIKENVLTNGANQIMGAIIEVAEHGGMKPLSDEQKQQAYSLAVSRYIDKGVKSGKISKEQLAQAGKQMSQTPEGQQIQQQMGAV